MQTKQTVRTQSMITQHKKAQKELLPVSQSQNLLVSKCEGKQTEIYICIE